MPGEMTTGSWFDVSELKAIEIETETGAQIESNIIDHGEEFFLRATFKGGGPSWVNMTNNEFQYRARFYAEGMGPDIDDEPLGVTTGNLVAGKHEYDIDSPVNTIRRHDAVYRCGVTVSFRTKDGGRWYGVLGFNEDCVMQVSWAEEWQ